MQTTLKFTNKPSTNASRELHRACTGVATMGPRGAMAPSLLSYFSIVSMSWFTFAIVSIFIIMLWPSHLFSARNAPVIGAIISVHIH